MLATIRDAVEEYTLWVGRDQPLVQWILSDYDSWEPNPFYIGPDLGHPEDGEPLGCVYGSFQAAAAQARYLAPILGHSLRVENYKGRCWVVWF